MADFKTLIRTESRKLYQLHRAIHENFKVRNTNKANFEAWKDACKQFHDYESALDIWVNRCLQSPNLSDPIALEFCIQFLEEDPMFFRSGYIKEDLISRLKRAALKKMDKSRIQQICTAAVQRNGRREYRRYCHLAASIRSDGLIQEILQFTHSENGAIRSRAKLMLRILYDTRKTKTKHK